MPQNGPHRGKNQLTLQQPAAVIIFYQLRISH